MIKYIKQTSARLNGPLSRARVGARLIGAFCAVALLSVSASAGDDAPDWLRQAARQAASPPALSGDAPAVVLLDEGSVKVEEDGRVISSARYAVRITKRRGNTPPSRARSIAPVRARSARSAPG